MVRSGKVNGFGFASARMALGALALLVLAACGKQQDATTTAAAPAGTPAAPARANVATTSTATSESIPTIIIEPAPLVPAVEPPNTTTTTLRHLNQESYQAIKVEPVNEHRCTFVVLGDSRGNTEVLARVLDQASQEKDLLFAVHVGNMVSTATEAQYAEFLKTVKDHLKVPLLTVPGPIDVTSGTDSSLYRQIFGWPTFYFFQIGHTCFAMADNSRRDALDQAQLGRIRKALGRYMGERHLFVFMNRPLSDPRVNGTQGMDPGQAEKLMPIFADYQIERIFSGNIPGFYSGTWEGARYYITGGAGAPLTGKDINHDFYNYMVVQVNETAVTVTVRRVKVPGAPVYKTPDGEEPKDLKVP